MPDWTIRHAGEQDIERVLSLWDTAGSAETVTDTRDGVRLVVHPDRRRQGIATALLREGEHRLLSRGSARFTSIVTDDDTDAMSFWTATGYEQQQSRARFVSNVGPQHLGP